MPGIDNRPALTQVQRSPHVGGAATPARVRQGPIWKVTHLIGRHTTRMAVRVVHAIATAAAEKTACAELLQFSWPCAKDASGFRFKRAEWPIDVFQALNNSAYQRATSCTCDPFNISFSFHPSIMPRSPMLVKIVSSPSALTRVIFLVYP